MIRAVVVSRMPWSQGIIEATGNTLPVGYVVHFKEQDELFDSLFC